MGSFVSRKLKYIITLGVAKYNGKDDRVTITDIRSDCNISFPGGQQFGHGAFSLYGLSQNIMNAVTTYNWTADSVYNSIEVFAGTTDEDMMIIFSGQIFRAYANYHSSPEVAFVIEAQTGLNEKLKLSSPISFKGPTKISDIAKAIAKDMSLELIDNGIEGALTDAAYSGTSAMKLIEFSKQANIDFYLNSKSLYVCKKGTPIVTPTTPYISPLTGLIGWPMPDGAGCINLDVLYNPAIIHGGKIDVESSFPNSTGEWYVISINHKLQSQTVGGSWMTSIIASRLQNNIKT